MDDNNTEKNINNMLDEDIKEQPKNDFEQSGDIPEKTKAEEELCSEQTEYNSKNQDDFSEQPDGENGVLNICKKCGANLKEGQMFCTNCGAEIKQTEFNTCSKCGNILYPGQAFCPTCGHKVQADNETGFLNKIRQITKGKISVIIIVIVVILLAVGVKTIGPKVFLSVEDLCRQGNYEKAYSKAKNSEKDEVVAENLATYLSAYSKDNLKDPTSFSLREAYYDGSETVVLYITGKNSYGANVSSYWLYVYSDSSDKFLYWDSLSDLTKEEYKSYDDADDKLEKDLDNMCRDMINETMLLGYELSKTQIDNINFLNENNLLDDVELLDVDFGDEGSEDSSDTK